MSDTRCNSTELTKIVTQLLARAGLPEEPAASVARGLVEADLLGHRTHGLALLADYVEEIEAGGMETAGRPTVINELGAVALWDARRLPGIWTTELAINAALEKAKAYGIGAVSLRRSHHIACLATFLEVPARAGFPVLVFSSDPGDSKVAPFGGVSPVLMPDPIAVGLPSTDNPVLIDVSTSIATMALTNRARQAGTPLPGRWLISPTGEATDDPTVVADGGALLPIGGLDHGHKGFGLGLMVEFLTQGLAGYGRADQPTEWGASVLVLVINPQAFGGLDAFLRQADFIGNACRAATPRKPETPVRLPGGAGLTRKKQYEKSGVPLEAPVWDSLLALSGKFNLDLPANLIM